MTQIIKYNVLIEATYEITNEGEMLKDILTDVSVLPEKDQSAFMMDGKMTVEGLVLTDRTLITALAQNIKKFHNRGIRDENESLAVVTDCLYKLIDMINASQSE